MESLDTHIKEADTGIGMEVANGYESDASREDTKPLTLAQRINRMVEHCDSIQKEGAGIGQGHAIDTVLASIRPLLSKYKINITPELYLARL